MPDLRQQRVANSTSNDQPKPHVSGVFEKLSLARSRYGSRIDQYDQHVLVSTSIKSGLAKCSGYCILAVSVSEDFDFCRP